MKRCAVVAVACVFAATGWAADATPAKPRDEPKRSDVDRFLEKYDKNKDGYLDRSECPEPLAAHFDRLDTNKDGKLSREELQRVEDRLGRFLDGKADSRPGGRPGETVTPPAKGGRQPDKLKVGDPAPDFTLPFAAGKKEVRLASFRDKRPVVLIFGSYT
jgi:hypothetical protein